MREWLESLAGPAYAGALMWTILALIALVVVLVAIRIVRSFTFGTFVAGGRNRRARLAVMDATAVDNQRRLVLVRRDDVEHLILIGGPSDVVVEQNIGMPVAEKHIAANERGEETTSFAPPRTNRPALGQPAISEPPSQRPAASTPSPRRNETTLPPRPAPSIAPMPMPMPVRSPPVATVPPAETPSILPDEQAASQSAAQEDSRPAAVGPESEEQSDSVARNVPQPAFPEERRTFIPPAPATPAPAIHSAAAGAALSGQDRLSPKPETPPERPQQPLTRDSHDLDDALLRELEVDLNKAEYRREPRLDSEDADNTLDAEMSRLLGELSGERRRD